MQRASPVTPSACTVGRHWNCWWSISELSRGPMGPKPTVMYSNTRALPVKMPLPPISSVASSVNSSESERHCALST